VVSWTTRDGLPQNSVTDITQSRDGYLWLTTFGGIARFDGRRFEVFELASHEGLQSIRFLSVLEDSQGILWFGTHERGLVRFEGGEFETVALPGVLADANVYDLAEDHEGAIWLASSRGLGRLKAGQVELVEGFDGGMDDLFIGSSGEVWVDGPDGLICVRGSCSLPLDSSLSGPLEWDGAGRLWGASGSELYLIDGRGARSIAQYGGTYYPKVVADNVRDRLWFTAFSGLRALESASQVDGPTEPVAVAPESLRDIRSLFLDREGSLWVGTDGHGLFQVSDRELQRFGRGHGLAHGVRTVLEDEDGFWVGAGCDGLFRWDGRVFSPVKGADWQPGCVGALAKDVEGTLWFGDSHRLGRYRGGEFDSLGPEHDLPDSPILALLSDSQGSLWIGTESAGVARLDGEQVSASYRAEDGLGDDSVHCIVEATDGALWFGTRRGVARLFEGRFERYGPAQGLSRGTVRDVAVEADGTAWIGTYGGGLTRLRKGRATRYTRADGLCDDVVSRILIRDDAVWMNGNRGIYRVRRAELESFAAGHSQSLHCTLLDSGEGNGGAQPAGWLAADGGMWFPTIHGLVSLDPSKLTQAYRSVTPKVTVERASIDGRPLSLGEDSSLPPGRGDLYLSFTGLSFRAPEQVVFRHRLLGHDARWADEHRDRTAHYTNLAPGSYRFEVQARSAQGLWSEKASLSFSLQPHFYETAWFYALCALFGSLALWAVIALRTRVIQARNRALLHEVTERRRVEVVLREREAHYRTLFQGATNGLFLHDARGWLVEVNPAACELLGIGQQALLDTKDLGWVHPSFQERYRALLEGALYGRKGGPCEVVFAPGQGVRLEVSLQVTPFDRQGMAHALVTAVDLTAERSAEHQHQQLEERLQQAQKLLALGKLVGGVAHDFNNLLTALRGQAWLLRSALEAGEPALRHAQEIEKNITRASALTEKLLVFSRQRPHSAELIDPRALLDQLHDVLGRLVRENIEFKLRHCALQGAVRADPVRLEQAIINLVVNGQDAMPDGGRLAVEDFALNLGQAEAEAHGVPAGPYTVIAVTDAGTGMDVTLRRRIFEPFFTTKPTGKGTGLGLASVHEFVEEAGGFVEVQSEVGEGSCFRICLPTVESKARKPRSAPPTREPLPRGSGVVLLCDDDEQARQTTAEILRLHGYQVLEADGPQQALAVARGHEAKSVGLILTDIFMPVMNGAELAQRLQQELGAVPVLYMSGHTQDVILEHAPLEDVPDLLAKPFTIEELLRGVAQNIV